MRERQRESECRDWKRRTEREREYGRERMRRYMDYFVV